MKAASIALFAGVIGCAFVQPASAEEPGKYTEEVLYSFSGLDGVEPDASVIDVNGTLYGTTYAGGNDDSGTVFSLNLSTGAEKVLYAFGGCDDAPLAGLIAVKGMLYGATSGADCSAGLVFSIDPNTDTEKTVYSFRGGEDGLDPTASLIHIADTLYGTTVLGGGTGCGGSGCGTVYALERKSGAEKVLYSFCGQPNCTDGETPWASLIAVNGMLYGTTLEGGGTGCYASGCGTVFSIDPATGAEKVLYSFCSQPNCADGAAPIAALLDVNGVLYGTTSAGGDTGCGGNGCGTVFSIDPTTGAEKVLYSFCSQPNCTDGAQPFASLINVNGVLYGTTAGGGNSCGGSGCGIVFSLDPATGAEKVLYSFCSQPNCVDGSTPFAGLINVKGTLYGTTAVGGDLNCGGSGCGTVFSLKKKP